MLLPLFGLCSYDLVMIEYVNESVSVLALFGSTDAKRRPIAFEWRGRRYRITEVGLHHTVQQGRVLHHIYTVSDGTTDFRLDFATDSQEWILEEVSDGARS